jgi:Tfp pilus assembly protein PilX
MKNHSDSPLAQSGSTLIMSMIILIILMLLGVTSMVVSDTQFKLSGNLQFADSAMNNAETAINAAENWLSTSPNELHTGFTTYNAGITPYTSNQHQLYPMLPAASPAHDPLTMTWDSSNSLVLSATQSYFIEMLSQNQTSSGTGLGKGGINSTPCNQVNTYLITARGASFRGAIKFIQSYYSVLTCP